MSDATLRDQAVAQLQLTTTTYPAWLSAGQPAGAWKNAFNLLAQISYVAPPPPTGIYGSGLPARLPETTRTITTVTTLATLKTAVAAGGDIRIPVGTTINVGTDINLTLTTPGTAGNPNMLSGGGKLIGRLLINSNYWRIRNLEITGSPYAGVLIAEGGAASNIEFDGLWVHHVGAHGIVTGTGASSYIQVWNCLIEECGQAAPTSSWQFHCISTGGPTSNWVIASNLIRPRNGYGIFLYPNPAGVTSVANTTIGGVSRGGHAIRGATNVQVVGDIITGSPTGAFEVGPTSRPTTAIQDTIQWANTQGVWGGGYTAPATVVNVQNVNPLLDANGNLGAGSPAASYVQAARYPLLPAQDRNGNLRVTADAGCHTAGYVAPPPPPPAGGMPDRSLAAWLALAGNPQVVVATSAAQFEQKLATLQAGQLLHVQGNFTIPGYHVITKRFPAWAFIRFDDGIKLDQQWFWQAARLAVWGGEFLGSDDFGAVASNCAEFRFWGARIHDCWKTPFLDHMNIGQNSKLSIAFEAWAWGQQTVQTGVDDSHPQEPGTGYHGAYSGGGNYYSTRPTLDSEYAVWLHDGATGSGLELIACDGARLWVDARRLTMAAEIMVAGNALQFYSSYLRNITVEYVYGEDLQGRVVDANLVGGGSVGQITVKKAVGLRCCKNPNINEPDPTNYFDPRGGISYVEKINLG